MTANFQELFINDINSSIIKMDGNSLANASVIIYKIYEISLATRAGKIINKIHKISLACEQEEKEKSTRSTRSRSLASRRMHLLKNHK